MASQVSAKAPAEKGIQLLQTVLNSNNVDMTNNIQELMTVVFKQQEIIAELSKKDLFYEEAFKQETQKRQEVISQVNMLNSKLAEENKALTERVNLLAKDLKDTHQNLGNARNEITQLKKDYNSLKTDFEKHQHTYSSCTDWVTIAKTTSQPHKN